MLPLTNTIPTKASIIAKRRRDRRREEGLCTRCGHTFEAEEHIANCVASNKRQKQRRKDAKLCTRCGYSPDSLEHASCLNKMTIASNFVRERNITAGRCRTHGDRIAVTRGNCEECWFRGIAYKALGSSTMWMELQKLFATQQERCAYSGEQLILGKNASVDHKIPLSRHGIKEISNIQFVTLKINKLKTWLTHEEFLIICKHSLISSSTDPTTILLKSICASVP